MSYLINCNKELINDVSLGVTLSRFETLGEEKNFQVSFSEIVKAVSSSRVHDGRQINQTLGRFLSVNWGK